MSTTNQSFRKNSIHMGYKLFLPEGYEERKNDVYPLLLFLHGIKKRGDDLSLLSDYGLLRVAEQNADFSYIVIAPQCPADTYWTDNRTVVMELLEDVISQYRVDRNRIYLTGFSMGGNGVWDLSAKTRGIFAAAVPIAGWYEVNEAENLISIPIWVFHGEEDETVPISQSVSMVNTIMNVGGKPMFTRYPGIDHSHIVMYETYTNPDLYSWLETNRLRDHSKD